MPKVTVGKWGNNLAVRIPHAVGRATGLKDGEHVEVEAHEGDILIRRPGAKARALAEARAAAREIIEESRQRFLGDVTIGALLEEGRGS
ncbi:MAG TPA: AbrB/MazE/SpoVT family DNA-binding domain-containing protein [Caulobacteraceae bacterium]